MKRKRASWEYWAVRVAIILVVLLVTGFVYVTGYEIYNPCTRYETRHSESVIIRYGTKGNPVYGPGYEKVCVEREKK